MGGAVGAAELEKRMNDDLQEALAEILNKTTQGVEAGVGFLQRELPEVIQQLLVWHMVKSAVTCLFFLTATCALAYGTARMWKWCLSEDDGSQVLCVFPGLAVLVSGYLTLASNSWLQILIAPKLYLIEYAASLVK